MKCSDILFFILFADDTTLIVDLDVYDQTLTNRELKKLSLWLKLNKLSIYIYIYVCVCMYMCMYACAQVIVYVCVCI